MVAGGSRVADHPQREIPFNYTSAGDRQMVSLLLGDELAGVLDELRSKRVTGRSSRLMMRFLGEILIHRRNPYLFQELVTSPARRRRLFGNAAKDLDTIELHSEGEPQVLQVLAGCRRLLADFTAAVVGTPAARRRMKRELEPIVGAGNLLFDPFALVAHATDATDWRLHLPVAVAMPGREEQVAPLLAAIAGLGLKAIPRGAGTGLTGGAVPLRADCVIINTERMDRIRGFRERAFPGEDGVERQATVLEVEAGVITEHAMAFAEERHLVFATDPTSAWASSIGGNIAENAGGKMAVRWGTCIDNLVSWRMAMPSGRTWTVRRAGHPLRKILPGDLVTFEVTEGDQLLRTITLDSGQIRNKGLWKDITNKALGGVPGLQKEGTDGVITSAEFILHPAYEEVRTICLEFFGPDFDEASEVILEIARAFPCPDAGAETLLALEHFDDEYVRAIAYRVKTPRADTPKAVLLIDVAGHDADQARAGVERLRALLEPHPNTFLYEAADAAEARHFWADRKKLGAIARRTNAFKLNEDIVIPLEALATFARFIADLNLQEERHSQTGFVDRAEAAFRDAIPGEDRQRLDAKLPAALRLCEEARPAIAQAQPGPLRSLALLETLRAELAGLAQGYPDLLAALERAHQELRARRIVLATHMHAGDGNVHVNVPVLSNDRAMMERADLVIDIVMAKVVALGGVVSGEHGIGVTKLKYLDKDRLEDLAAHRREVDPGGLMNPGKLEDFAALRQIFTPSFNLLELEARILQHGQLEELARKIAHCVRCGKCKPDCCVFYPERGLFYHPRNKNLAIGSLIEALLYDAQRERSTRFELLRWLEEVADHCTICHRCLKPCPVDIDTGEVSVLERETLAAWGYKKTPAITKLTLHYLNNRSVTYNRLFRTTVMKAGGAAQRAAHTLAAPFQPKAGPSGSKVMSMLRSSVPPLSARALHEVLPACEADQALVFEPASEALTTVFYFPGCGSERLHASVAMAAIHILLEARTRVVLPPPFLCCGFPAHSNAKTGQHGRLVLRDTILFSQIRSMFAHLEFDACVVTCGTCMESLAGMDADRLFGGRIVDLAAYAQERGLRLPPAVPGAPDLYHAPCHDSLGGRAEKVLAQLGGFTGLEKVPHCCSEAGTLALSRPDITDAMLHRKREALQGAQCGRGTVLTNCPSCLQGLGRNRQTGPKGLAPKHLAVALAERHSGPGWAERFAAQAARAAAITF